MEKHDLYRNDANISLNSRIEVSKFATEAFDIKGYSPRSYPTRGGFDAYAVILGKFPLQDRAIRKLQHNLEDVFDTKLEISELSHLIAGINPSIFPSPRVNDNPKRRAEHYSIPIASKGVEEIYIVRVVPFDDIIVASPMVKNPAATIKKVSRVISDHGMIDSYTFVKPCVVIGKPESYNDWIGWNIAESYCQHFNIPLVRIPKDLSNHN